MELTQSLFVGLIGIALSFQYLAASFGVGYGTPLTPVLLIMGFSPLQIIPAVLLSQLAGGLAGGLAHHRAGNISLDFRQDEGIRKRLRGLGYLPRSIDSKVVFVLVGCGAVGVILGAFTAVNIPTIALEIYIGAMVLGIGLAILLQRNRASMFSWRRLTALGILGAFNKGVSGGGYVPLVTGGQIISGREARNSVATTTLAVAIVCGVGFLSYFLLRGNIYWMLVVATTIGAVAAAPLAARTVQKASSQKLRLIIGIATIALGSVTLTRIFNF